MRSFSRESVRAVLAALGLQRTRRSIAVRLPALAQGQTVAVDAFCWLHRSAYLCPKELAEGEYATKYVHFCLEVRSRARMARRTVAPDIVIGPFCIDELSAEDQDAD